MVDTICVNSSSWHWSTLERIICFFPYLSKHIAQFNIDWFMSYTWCILIKVIWQNQISWNQIANLYLYTWFPLDFPKLLSLLLILSFRIFTISEQEHLWTKIVFFLHGYPPKTSKCQPVSKFWTFWWDLLCNLTLFSFECKSLFSKDVLPTPATL